MRIGFVIYGSLDTLSGGYLYDTFIINGLRAQGHEVEVISLPSGTYLSKVVDGFLPKLRRQLREGSFDVIIQDELCHPTLFWSNSALRRRSGPYLIALVHHVFSQEQRNKLLNKLFSFIEHRYLRSVDAFIHNSATTRDVVASLISHFKPEVVAYPSGSRFSSQLTHEEITKRSQAQGPLQLLFLGNIIPRKGLLPLLENLATVDKTLFQLTIVGNPSFDKEYSRLVFSFIEQAGLEGSVSMRGTLEDDELHQTLKTHQVFCMPYAYEGFGMAMLEAMSFGQVPLVSTTGAAGETVQHGKNGYLVEPQSDGVLQALLTELYHDRTKLAELSLSARETFESAPDWHDAIQTIDQFLQTLVNNTTGKRERENHAR